jgi:hypothetical protein
MEAAMKQLLLAIPPEWVAFGAVCGLMVVGAIIVVVCIAAIALALGSIATQYVEDIDHWRGSHPSKPAPSGGWTAQRSGQQPDSQS